MGSIFDTYFYYEENGRICRKRIALAYPWQKEYVWLKTTFGDYTRESPEWGMNPLSFYSFACYSMINDIANEYPTVYYSTAEAARKKQTDKALLDNEFINGHIQFWEWVKRRREGIAKEMSEKEKNEVTRPSEAQEERTRLVTRRKTMKEFPTYTLREDVEFYANVRGEVRRICLSGWKPQEAAPGEWFCRPTCVFEDGTIHQFQTTYYAHDPVHLLAHMFRGYTRHVIDFVKKNGVPRLYSIRAHAERDDTTYFPIEPESLEYLLRSRRAWGLVSDLHAFEKS